MIATVPRDRLDATSVYGNCPQANCNAPGVRRERGFNGFDTCARGHRYPSKMAVDAVKSPAKKQSYVCGFMFDPLGGLVVLVEKDRPAWQAGKHNGVGGKIEPGEDRHVAMTREFYEETGVHTIAAEWEEFATLSGPDFEVHMFRAFSDDWIKVRTMETEKIGYFPTMAVLTGVLPCVRNLKFLVPLALDRSGLSLPVKFTDVVPDEANA